MYFFFNFIVAKSTKNLQFLSVRHYGIKHIFYMIKPSRHPSPRILSFCKTETVYPKWHAFTHTIICSVLPSDLPLILFSFCMRTHVSVIFLMKVCGDSCSHISFVEKYFASIFQRIIFIGYRTLHCLLLSSSTV